LKCCFKSLTDNKMLIAAPVHSGEEATCRPPCCCNAASSLWPTTRCSSPPLPSIQVKRRPGPLPVA